MELNKIEKNQRYKLIIANKWNGKRKGLVPEVRRTQKDPAGDFWEQHDEELGVVEEKHQQLQFVWIEWEECTDFNQKDTFAECDLR